MIMTLAREDKLLTNIGKKGINKCIRQRRSGMRCKEYIWMRWTDYLFTNEEVNIKDYGFESIE